MFLISHIFITGNDVIRFQNLETPYEEFLALYKSLTEDCKMKERFPSWVYALENCYVSVGKAVYFSFDGLLTV